MQFEEVPDVARQVPHCLRVQVAEGEKQRYLRLTHQFGDHFYAVWVTDSSGAREACKPSKFTSAQLAEMEAEGGVWGRLAPPNELMVPGLTGAEASKDAPKKPKKVDKTSKVDPTAPGWRLIGALVEIFSVERNLKSKNFARLIQEQATKLEASLTTIRRLLLRYYYFGQIPEAVIALPPGPKPKTAKERLAQARSALAVQGPAKGSNKAAVLAAAGDMAPESSEAEPPEGDAPPTEEGRAEPKRRGRKASVNATRGPNTFVVGPDDIDDMCKRLAILAKSDRVFVNYAHERYLAIDFKKRHPELYEAYSDGRHPEPVTLRQFRVYTSLHGDFSLEVLKNLRRRKKGGSKGGSLDAIGPADVYEVDATEGRIVLTTAGPKRKVVAKPTIYIIIDRWSRFIVSVYISLKAPAWDELRYALLIAFSSRVKRFKALGIDIDDERWPIGRVCSVLRRDRGSDMTSESMDQVVSGDLRIDPGTLPSRTPNGKAIIERFIRTMKAWMAQEVTGAFADRPMDLHSKTNAKRKAKVSVTSLAELYRELIRFVEEYNNKPHSLLKRRSNLIQNGVPPTPQAAYLWGLENITGRRIPTHTDEQLRQMLLGVARGSIAQGEVLFDGWRYAPSNSAAWDFARASSVKRKGIELRVDKTFPQFVYVPLRTGWAEFEMVAADMRTLGAMTSEEREVLAPEANADARDIEHDQRRDRVTGQNRTKPKPASGAAPALPTGRQNVDRTPQSPANLAASRQTATTDVKAHLQGIQGTNGAASRPPAAKKRTTSSAVPAWKQRLEANKQKSTNALRGKR